MKTLTNNQRKEEGNNRGLSLSIYIESNYDNLQTIFDVCELLHPNEYEKKSTGNTPK